MQENQDTIHTRHLVTLQMTSFTCRPEVRGWVDSRGRAIVGRRSI